jgi:ATP-binding cassette subfamily C (CFTR/MRP) protein 1
VFDKLQASTSRGDNIGAGCVLRNLNFKTTNREKIGIVGRTGAGKSSLSLSLFRISELARGKVLIDGVDISTLSLTCLRSAIEIVPQNPVVFKGTLRNYIDPFDEYDDAQIWAALKKARLVSMVEKMGSSLGKEGLLVEIAENGENMSVGQRQMLVMSRALLREAKILVMVRIMCLLMIV